MTPETFRCHTNHSAKLSFRHVQDRFLTTNRETWGKKGPLFRKVCVLTFRGPFASRDSNPHLNHNGIAQDKATKLKSYAGSGLPQGPFWKTISTPLEVGSEWVLSMSRNGSKVGINVGFDLSSPTLAPT